jgi:hypothetical protein
MTEKPLDPAPFAAWLRARAAAQGCPWPSAPDAASIHVERPPEAPFAGAGTVQDHAASRPPAIREPSGRWLKGIPSPNPSGRPKATRDRLSGDFIAKLAADFAERGEDAIRRARDGDPLGYLNLVARLVPKDFRGAGDDNGARSMLERFGAAELVELRKQLEEAVALARAGVPVALPPILAEIHEDPNR